MSVGIWKSRCLYLRRCGSWKRYYVPIVKKFYSTLYWNGSKHCSACNVRCVLCVFLTRSEISLQFSIVDTQRNLRTSATSVKQYRQIDPGEMPFFENARDTQLSHTRYIFIDSHGDNINSKLRGTIFRVSCRVAESRGRISSARETFNIAESSHNMSL